MIIDDEKRIVEFWLTAAEQKDSELMDSLQPLYDVWHKKKYRPVVFRSGGRDLLNLTEDLLLHNRTVAARREMELEEQAVTLGMGVTMNL